MEQYNVTGMSCAACSTRVEKAVLKVDGVTSCSVSLLTNSMGVDGTATPEQIIEAVEKAGYGASMKGKGTEKLKEVRDEDFLNIEQMKKNVADALAIEVSQVNIKATTEEGLGFTGSGEGISAQAIASLETIVNYSYGVGPAESSKV